MPSVSGGELIELARTWNVGNRAFREMFELLPKEEGRSYNELVYREGEVSVIQALAMEDCNDVWSRDEARAATKESVKAIAKRKRDGADAKELRNLRRELRKERRDIVDELLEADGIFGAINRSMSPREGFRNKVILITCLGRTIREFQEDNDEEDLP